MLRSNFTIEACVENYTEAKYAAHQGVNKLELCSALHQDGLTPEITDIQRCLEELEIPLKVMLRPRAGNFEYGPLDKTIIKDQLRWLQSLAVKHLVYGSLKNGRLDLDDFKTIVEPFASSGSLESITLHKAIDQSEKILTDVELLLNNLSFFGQTKVSILTSGGALTAMKGKKMINEMVLLCKDQIQIIAAGKITHLNLIAHIKALKCQAFHGRRIVRLKE